MCIDYTLLLFYFIFFLAHFIFLYNMHGNVHSYSYLDFWSQYNFASHLCVDVFFFYCLVLNAIYICEFIFQSILQNIIILYRLYVHVHTHTCSHSNCAHLTWKQKRQKKKMKRKFNLSILKPLPLYTNLYTTFVKLG